jgi:hypothetical protein
MKSASDDDKCIEQVKTDSSNNEQVHGGDIWGVIAQESEPSLARRSSPFYHVLRNARLSDRKPKLEKLAMDARRSPNRVLHAHLPDQRTQPHLDLRPAAQRS